MSEEVLLKVTFLNTSMQSRLLYNIPIEHMRLAGRKQNLFHGFMQEVAAAAP